MRGGEGEGSVAERGRPSQVSNACLRRGVNKRQHKTASAVDSDGASALPACVTTCATPTRPVSAGVGLACLVSMSSWWSFVTISHFLSQLVPS